MFAFSKTGLETITETFNKTAKIVSLDEIKGKVGDKLVDSLGAFIGGFHIGSGIDPFLDYVVESCKSGDRVAKTLRMPDRIVYVGQSEGSLPSKKQPIYLDTSALDDFFETERIKRYLYFVKKDGVTVLACQQALKESVQEAKDCTQDVVRGAIKPLIP